MLDFWGVSFYNISLDLNVIFTRAKSQLKYCLALVKISVNMKASGSQRCVCFHKTDDRCVNVPPAISARISSQ